MATLSPPKLWFTATGLDVLQWLRRVPAQRSAKVGLTCARFGKSQPLMTKRRAFLALGITVFGALCAAIALRSCGRLRVPGRMKNIEWVMVDCHEESVASPWVARITPGRHPELVGELLGAIRKAKRGPPTKSEGDCFIVFKVKGGGVQGFNFVAWEGEPEIEIKPGFFSRKLPALLKRIQQGRIGWETDGSVGEVRVKQIELRQDGERVASFGPDSPWFARLVPAAQEVVKAVDPRICTQDPPEGDLAKSVEDGGYVQFTVTLQEPVRVSKVTVRLEVGTEVADIGYVSFPSSAVAMVIGLGSGERPSWPSRITFQDAREQGQWHGWELWDLIAAARTMGRPDPEECLARLLEAYNEAVRLGGSSALD